jgi:hypothetical protein
MKARFFEMLSPVLYHLDKPFQLGNMTPYSHFNYDTQITYWSRSSVVGMATVYGLDS